MPAAPSSAVMCYENRRSRVDFHGQVFQRQVRWKVDTGEVDDFLAHLAGDVETIGGAAVLVRARHPLDSSCFAVSADEEETGNSLTTRLHAFSFFDVTYERPRYDLTGDVPYVTFGFAGGGSDVTTNGPAYSVGGVPLNIPVAIRCPTATLFATSHNRPLINEARISVARRAPVNSVAFRTRYGNYPPGTVMFDDIQTQETFQVGGSYSYEVTLRFLVRENITWLQAINPVSGVVGTVSPAPYLTSDLNLLFR